MEYSNITIDAKRNRIRFYKTLLKSLGNPQYIRIMVNREKKIFMVLSGEKGVDSIKINSHLQSDNSYEIHSKLFIEKLCEMMNWTDISCSYRIEGDLENAPESVAFNLENAIKLNSEGIETNE